MKGICLHAWFIVFLHTMIFTVGGCVDQQGQPVAQSGCLDDLPAGTVVELVEEMPDRTEGLALAEDGTLFVSTENAVYGISPTGRFALVASLESALGLAVRGDDIYVAGFKTGLIEKVTRSGTHTPIGRNLGQPNFLVLTPWDTLLVADDFTDRISEITFAGVATVWAEGITSPNGMVFSADGRHLYVSITFDEPPALKEIEVVAQKAGKIRTLAVFPDGSSPDGIALDGRGMIYVPLNLAKKIVRVDPAAVATDNWAIVAEEVPNPASIAFGRPPFDPCSLYATNLFGLSINRVVIGSGALSK